MPASVSAPTDRLKEATSYMQWLASVSKDPGTSTSDQGGMNLGYIGGKEVLEEHQPAQFVQLQQQDRWPGGTPLKTPQWKHTRTICCHSTGKGNMEAEAVGSDQPCIDTNTELLHKKYGRTQAPPSG
ncbi:unnamed protein product [Ostreobium quekettii]|uniref:Uncharacterized protein n=1 Tax=Ostreobium quekettii TaxID=121088 RepID=A0A8S1JID0_9CHLO|nr:unnamed protein product [Ostreobium quekettii]